MSLRGSRANLARLWLILVASSGCSLALDTTELRRTDASALPDSGADADVDAGLDALGDSGVDASRMDGGVDELGCPIVTPMLPLVPTAIVRDRERAQTGFLVCLSSAVTMRTDIVIQVGGEALETAAAPGENHASFEYVVALFNRPFRVSLGSADPVTLPNDFLPEVETLMLAARSEFGGPLPSMDIADTGLTSTYTHHRIGVFRGHSRFQVSSETFG